MIGFLGKGQAVLDSGNAGGELFLGTRYFALPCTHLVQGFGMVADPDVNNQGSPDEFVPFNSNTWQVYSQATFISARTFTNPLWSIPTVGPFIPNRINRLNVSNYLGTIRMIRFRHNTPVIAPPARQLRGRISDPNEVIMLTFYSENNPGVNFSGNETQFAGDMGIQLSQFPNCRMVVMARQAITRVASWPASLEIIFMRNMAVLTSIGKFPKTLKHITWGTPDNLDASFYNHALEDCTDLEDLYFAFDSGYPVTFGFGSAGITGALDLTGKDKLKVITMLGSPALNWILPSDVSNMEVFDVRNANLKTVNVPTLQSILSNGKVISFWTEQNPAMIWNRNFVSGDFSTSLKWFAAINSGLSGTIAITAPHPNITYFWLGNGHAASTNSNVISQVDVSGLTGVMQLDLSGCDIETLTLPIQTSLSVLVLFGNKLSVAANPNLVNQIRGCTGLTNLQLGAGFTPDVGQNSADGFGNNLNLDTLVNLSTLMIESCRLTGKVTLPNVAKLVILTARSNPDLQGFNNLATHGSTLTSINADYCDSIQLPDLHAMTKLVSLFARYAGISMVDLSGRTSTNPIGQILVNNCANLSSLIFPAAPGAATISLDVHAFSCPNLASITNMTNVAYTSPVAALRRWYVNNCPLLNVPFPFGVNNFLPGAIEIHNNNMSQANVDATIDSIYQNRAKDWGTGQRSLLIHGTNAAPSGVYQAPVGFVEDLNDGSPASSKEKAYVLVKNYGWMIAMN